MSNLQRKKEPLLEDDSSEIYVQLPVKYPELQDMFWKAEKTFWSSKEIDYSADLADWESLTPEERHFFSHILAFFAGSDGIVLENLILNFSKEVKATEARNFYGFQAHIENTHGLTYASLLDTLIKDKKQKDKLFRAIVTIPCVKKKADWAMKWMNPSLPFEERLLAFCIVEGLFFSASFCSIFWLKSRNKMTKALGKSNELIARDEQLHTEFAILLYKHLNNKVSQEKAAEIFTEAVEIETEFICESIPCKMIGMNSDLMTDYIKYVADRLLSQLDFDKIYNVDNPFDFMKTFGIDGKTNFFEARTTEYIHSGHCAATGEESWSFSGEVDF